MKDTISQTRLLELHPKCRDTFRQFIEDAENTLGIVLRIMEPVYRSIEDQNKLYAQGRTAPGKIVTKAKGGQSFHNYGLAVDLCRMNGKNVDWGYDMGKVAVVANKYNIEWGGNWHTIKDKPHFQITYGYTWEQLLEMHNSGKVDAGGYVIL